MKLSKRAFEPLLTLLAIAICLGLLWFFAYL